MANDIPAQEHDEVDTTKPTVITSKISFDRKKNRYEVELDASQDKLSIESTGPVTFYDFMSAKLYIDTFVDKFKEVTHDD